MTNKISKNELRLHRKGRSRAKISGTVEIPRICVFKSNTAFYAQLINDEKGNTLASIDSGKRKEKKLDLEVVEKLGEKFAQDVIKKGFKKVVFDRSGYVYHGRVKAFADGARKKGLEF